MARTVKQIEAAKHGIQKERMSDGSSRYLPLYPSGKKVSQVQVSKEPGSSSGVPVSLGVFPELSLKEARNVAGWVRLQSSRGWAAAPRCVRMTAQPAMHL